MLARLILKAAIAFAAAAPATASAQEAAVVTGRVTGEAGTPENGVRLRIESLNTTAVTDWDGAYRLVVPGARIAARPSVEIEASRAGLAPQRRAVTLYPGAQVTHNFQLGAAVLGVEDTLQTEAEIDSVEEEEEPAEQEEQEEEEEVEECDPDEEDCG